MNFFFLLSLLVTVALAIPVNPEEPSTEHSTIPDVKVSHPTTSSAPAPAKVTPSSESDPVLESKELDKESDESDESDESKESNESQNSKEADLPSHKPNVTKTAESSKDSIDVSAPVQKTKPDPPSSTSVKMSEPDTTTVSVTTVSDATLLPSKSDLNASQEVPPSLNK